VGAFVHKLLRRRKANAAIAARNEGNFSFELAHVEASSVQLRLAQLFSGSFASSGISSSLSRLTTERICAFLLILPKASACA
jgi:hypothetical protein